MFKDKEIVIIDDILPDENVVMFDSYQIKKLEKDIAAQRRQHQNRMKQRVIKVIMRWGFDASPGRIGKWASTHGKPCSCFMCGNPRKFFGERTRQEQIADLDFKEMIEEM